MSHMNSSDENLWGFTLYFDSFFTNSTAAHRLYDCNVTFQMMLQLHIYCTHPAQYSDTFPMCPRQLKTAPPHQALEEFSELLVVLNHLLSEQPPVLTAAAHQPLLH